MALSKRLRFEVLRRDNHTCRYCGRTAAETKLTVDHVVPTALGGSDDPGNLVAACADCNAGKSASNPDASLVANVADDALRWAAAIRQSADQMLGELGHREADRRAFRTEWDGWTFGPKEFRVPLPDGWERSVDSFLAAGLPMPILIDALRKAMQSAKVAPDQTFRYMCGIAWKKVSELQELARAAVGSSVSASTEPEVSAVDLVEFLWGAFPFEVNAELVVEWAQKCRDERDGDEERPDIAEWPDELCGFIYALNMLAEDYYYADIAWKLLKKVPGFRRDQWMREGAKVHIENGDDTPTNAQIERTAATLAFDHYYRHSPDFLDDQPPF